MSRIDLVEQVQRFPDRGADRVAAVDELPVVADVLVEVVEQFLWDLHAYLRHVPVFAEPSHQRTARPATEAVDATRRPSRPAGVGPAVDNVYLSVNT